jgi:hypothetical protein
MKHVFDKLGVASRSEVTHLAFETGLSNPATPSEPSAGLASVAPWST